MRKLFLVGMGVALLAVAGMANATFHTFRINEIYSNADGSVQFVELVESFGANGQNRFFSDGAVLESSSGITTNTLNFPNDLPSNATANRFVLIATAGFAALPEGITPDYVIPDDFLFTGGGDLDFVFVETVAYGALPAGVLSLNRMGGTFTPDINSPTNFAGQTTIINNPIPLPAALWLFAAGLAGLLSRAGRFGGRR